MNVVRLFCICCAAVVRPLAPLAIVSVTTSRAHPVALDGSRISGTSVVTRDGRIVEAIRFGETPWVAAASPEGRRRFRNVPVETTIAYRLQDGSVVAGEVTNVPADRATIVRRLVLALLALVATLAGLALGLAGRNRAATSAGGFLAGLGVTLAFGFLEPNLVRIGSPAWRDAVIVAYALVPGALWCRYLLLLAAELPSALKIGRGLRVVIAAVSVTAVARAMLSAVSQVLDAVWLVPLLETGVLQVVPYLVTAGATVVLIVRQARYGTYRTYGTYGTYGTDGTDGAAGPALLSVSRGAAPRSLRRVGNRARLVAWGCGLGVGIPVIAALLQALSLVATKELLLPRVAMALLLLPLLLVPLSLTYALLARRVERAGVLAQRAVIFVIAERTLTILSLIPFVSLTAIFYTHRDQPIGRVATTRLPLIVMLAVLAVAGFFFAAPLRRALERLFFRDRTQAHRLLGELARRVRDAADAGALTSLLTEGIDAALHLEAVEFLTDDRDLRALDRFRLLLPLHGGDGRFLGLVALGEPMSGLPFDGEVRALLAVVAASAALRLEQFPRVNVERTVERTESPDRALLCTSCASVYEPMLSVRCARDEMPLIPADVPHILHGKFRFDQRLGAGAMGVVYRARDLLLERDVAIKTLPALSSDAITRFEQEARAVAALSHRSIATIHAAESWRGRPMLVFELLERESLAARLPLHPTEVVRIGAELADALAHAHSAGVLHRDVKPANVAFSRDGAAKLLDFGLAQFGAVDAGHMAGTPLYLSPETILGAPATPLADVWSVAVTLYEAVTGRPPFTAPTTPLVMNAILGHDAPDPRSMRAEVPSALAAVLLRALQRDASTRIRTAAELRDALISAV
ncbi:MAG TPA: serine/threonine-protein kinase [Thermoanaerobaculia bacterium]|jgi:serine/threonine-protein kinase